MPPSIPPLGDIPPEYQHMLFSGEWPTQGDSYTEALFFFCAYAEHFLMAACRGGESCREIIRALMQWYEAGSMSLNSARVILDAELRIAQWIGNCDFVQYRNAGE